MNPETTLGYIRTFVALPVAETVREAVGRELERWRDVLPARAIRWVRPERLHITLRFFGRVASAQIDELAQALERAVGGVPPFSLAAEGFGVFPSPRNPRVLWVGVSGQLDALHRLQRQIESGTTGFGEPREASEFRAHLTVARVKNATAQEQSRISAYLGNLTARFVGSWRIDHVELMQSQLLPSGSCYTCLRSILLVAN